jgi:hypothetical protein
MKYVVAQNKGIRYITENIEIKKVLSFIGVRLGRK